MSDDTTSVNNAVSCYRPKEAVQLSVSFVTSLFASFSQNLWNGSRFCVIIIQVTLIKIANTPPVRGQQR